MCNNEALVSLVFRNSTSCEIFLGRDRARVRGSNLARGSWKNDGIGQPSENYLVVNHKHILERLEFKVVNPPSMNNGDVAQ
jgi:hypothetical protein